jgi:hypothetical protein
MREFIYLFKFLFPDNEFHEETAERKSESNNLKVLRHLSNYLNSSTKNYESNFLNISIKSIDSNPLGRKFKFPFNF